MVVFPFGGNTLAAVGFLVGALQANNIYISTADPPN